MTIFGYRENREHGTVRSITWAWIALMVITIGSWSLAPAHASHAVQASVPITALVLAMTWVKTRMVFQHFMEVNTAPKWLKYATDGWLTGLLVTVFVIYLF